MVTSSGASTNKILLYMSTISAEPFWVVSQPVVKNMQFFDLRMDTQFD